MIATFIPITNSANGTREAESDVGKTQTFFQCTKQIWLPGFDKVLQRTVAMDVRVSASEHRTSRLRADTGLQETIGELCPSLSQEIDVRGANHFVAKTSQ